MGREKKSLAEQLAELESAAPQDHDPELADDPFASIGLADDGEDDGDEALARQHYVEVGKSSLRNAVGGFLDDPKYSGVRTGRKALYGEEDDEEADESDEEEGKGSDEREVDHDDAGSDVADMESASEEDAASDSEVDAADNGASSDEENVSTSDDNEDEERITKHDNSQLSKELAKFEQEEQEMIKGLSVAAKEDVERGRGVQHQMSLFDGLLDARIRMQKVLALGNQLPQPDTYPLFIQEAETITDDTLFPQLANAKTAVLDLMDSITGLRIDLMTANDQVVVSKDVAKARKKRRAMWTHSKQDTNNDEVHEDEDEGADKKRARRAKAPDAEVDDALLNAYWDDLQGLNAVYEPYANATLEKWSDRTALSSAGTAKKFKAFDQGITRQVDNVLAGDWERIRDRTRIWRGDGRVIGHKAHRKEEQEETQEESTSKHDAHIFDDTDFYQHLLRDLIESRMTDTDDPIALSTRWAALRLSSHQKSSGLDATRGKKQVDTKASKGRRLRYHVHEKLEGFMAPIPLAGAWHDDMVDELYGSLLGSKAGAGQNVEGEEGEEDDDDDDEEFRVVNGQSEGLRIFG
ncbi:hypothetical protein BZG36_05017 [Bifiguratus adelaidae]|uniref:Protein BFR2 n=1 Tax=Bifiguratus adelaidae TaxID=1938954 RepID=A0A261XUG3_9FUNG|nr:hypothetical protein BZG36_05017 [Bifiguratus adelaidae]